MKSVLVSAVLVAVYAVTPAFAQPPAVTAEGNVKVEGVAPEKVLGAIDTEKLVEDQPVDTARTQPTAEAGTSVTVDTTVQETPTARVETTTEVIAQVSTRPQLDPENPIAPEVKSLVQSKPNYTTKDIAAAQLAAVLATPPSLPTTIVTTTRTTPREGG